MLSDILLHNTTKKPDWKCVVRVSTSRWWDGRSYHCDRQVYILRRKSYGYCPLEGEVSNSGAEDVSYTILNIDTVDDGIYEVIMTYYSSAMDYGESDDVEYKLVPYIENEAIV